MVETITFLLHILLWPLCLGMIGMILLQGGAGDLSSAFGGGGMLDSTLGVGASKKMAKVTGWLAAIFFSFVLFLAIPHRGGVGGEGTGSKLSTGAAAVSTPAAPTTPVAPSAPQLQPATAPALAPSPVPHIQAEVKTQAQAAVDMAKDAAHTVVAPVGEKVEAAQKVEAPAVVAPVVPVAPAAPVDAKPAQ